MRIGKFGTLIIYLQRNKTHRIMQNAQQSSNSLIWHAYVLENQRKHKLKWTVKKKSMEKKKGAKSPRNSMGLTVWLMMTEGWLTECTCQELFQPTFKRHFSDHLLSNYLLLNPLCSDMTVHMLVLTLQLSDHPLSWEHYTLYWYTSRVMLLDTFSFQLN